MKLNIVIRAPLLIVPYTPSLSLPLSPLESPVSHTQRAFVANLGELLVKNEFKLASTVSAEVVDKTQFVSASGLPAVVDCMTLTISSVELSRS